MSQITLINLAGDTGIGIPALTLTPISAQSGSQPAEWRNLSATSYEQGENLSCLVRQASAQNQRVTIRFRKPIVREVNGVMTTVSTVTCELTATLPRNTSSADRNAAKAYITQVLNETFASDALVNLAPVY